MKEYNRQLLHPFSLLEELIWKYQAILTKILRESDSRSKAGKIRNLKELIGTLYQILDGLRYLNRYDLWVAAENQMEQMEEQISNISGFHVYLDYDKYLVIVCPLVRKIGV